MYTKPDTPWFEVEGAVGDDWFPLYQAATREEGSTYLRWALEQTDPIHDRFEDFRLSSPTVILDRTGRAVFERPVRRRRAA